jgi:hypothetical protein
MTSTQINEPNGIVHRHSPEHIAGVYQDAVKNIREALQKVAGELGRINEVFGSDSCIYFETRHLNFADCSDEIKAMDRRAWRRVVDIAGVRRVLSVRKAEEMDTQIERGDLPPLTAESIRSFIADSAANAGQYLAESVKEVHGWLRPTNDRYKTNSQFDIGERVVLTGMVRPGLTAGKFQISYWAGASQRLRALQNVFSMLAGSQPKETHHGALGDAIEACQEGKGETEFFEFRCFQNGNLHLRFRRMDLVERLNAIAGGRNLYAPGSKKD